MATWSDKDRIIRPLLEFNPTGSAWIDITANLISCNGVNSTLELWQYAQGREFPPSTAQFILNEGNTNFNPDYVSGSYYNNIKETAGLGYNIPIRFSIELKNGVSWITERVFTGYIEKIDSLGYTTNQVQLSCMDNTLPFVKSAKSTILNTDKTTSEWITILKNLAGVSTTDYDTGLFKHPYLWLDDEAISAEMALAAQCEMGRIGFDRNGVHCFNNFTSWFSKTRHNSVQRAFTTNSFTEIKAPSDYNNIHNSVIVIYSQRNLGAVGKVYNIQRPEIIPKGESKKIICRHNPILGTVLPSGGDFVRASAGGLDISSDVSIAIVPYAQRTEVTITNSNTQHAAYVTSLNINGLQLLGGALEEVTGEVSLGFLPNPKTLRFADSSGAINNMYIGTREQAEFIKTILLDNVSNHRRKFIISTFADPTLWPCDRISVNTPEIGTREAHITRCAWSFQGLSYKATYTAVGADNFAPFEDSELFKLGENKPNDNKVIWY